MNDTVIIPAIQSHQYTIIWLHGLGADGNDFVPIAKQLNFAKAENTKYIFPHAPVIPVTVNLGIEMRAWFDIHELGDTVSVDVEQMHRSADRITQMIDDEIAAGIPAKQIMLAGFSQGGSVALVTSLKYPQQLGGLIFLSSLIAPVHYEQIDHHASNFAMPIFIGHGSFDTVIPLNAGKATHDHLQKLGYKLEWHEYAMDHGVCGEEVNDVNNFLQNHWR